MPPFAFVLPVMFMSCMPYHIQPGEVMQNWHIKQPVVITLAEGALLKDAMIELQVDYDVFCGRAVVVLSK